MCTSYIEPYHRNLSGKWKEIALFRLGFAERHIKDNSYLRDIGCGDEYIMNLLGNLTKEVVGIDTSISGLRYAKKMSKHANFLLASASHLPFRQQCFDAVTIFEVIEHIDAKETGRLLSEIHRLLRNKGRLLLTIPNPRHLGNLILGKRKVSDKHSIEYTQTHLRKLLDKKFAILTVTGIYIDLPLLNLLTKPKFKTIYTVLISSGKIMPSLSMFSCVAAERLKY